MLLGHRWATLFRPYFAWIAKRYDRMAEESDLMSSEYYWLRHFEAQLLAGRTLNAGLVSEQLDEIEKANELIQENAQVGNAHAYRALWNATSNRAMPEETERVLKTAEQAWLRSGPNMEAGRRRLVLFRRYLFPDAISFRRAWQEFAEEGEESENKSAPQSVHGSSRGESSS